MTGITPDTKLNDIRALPEMADYRKYLLYSAKDLFNVSPFDDGSVRDLGRIGWKPEGIVSGLDFFLKAIRNGRVSRFFVYPDTDEPYKNDVNLIRISPATPDGSRPFIVLCAGGGYQSVCTLVESLPTARHMVREGYTVFLMTYRAGVPEAAVKALEDLGAAISFLVSNAGTLGIDPARYAVGGFSAGANLVCNFGCAHIGWKRLGVPKPLCLFPVYTVIDLKAEAARNENGGFAQVMLGEKWREKLDEYNVAEPHRRRLSPLLYRVRQGRQSRASRQFRADEAVAGRSGRAMRARRGRARVPRLRGRHGYGRGGLAAARSRVHGIHYGKDRMTGMRRQPPVFRSPASESI
ncbi:MAG: alpha/beta hydrolase [Clostridiales bacterium]|nr:alpha/beta hydrolase [Clostridiales bacterium]